MGYTVFVKCGKTGFDPNSLGGQTLDEAVKGSPLRYLARGVGKTEAEATRDAAFAEFDDYDPEDCPPPWITFIVFETDCSGRILRFVGAKKKKLRTSRVVQFSWGDDSIDFEF